ncbi:MAG TPA: DUF5666 domain-containing protein [Acidobacteriota bacterium]|nr:DUF5666 domain-containing protein [Acidobacteriota bacterium]
MLVLSRIALFLTFGFTLCISPASLFAQSFNTNSGNDDVKFAGTIESLPSNGSLLGDWKVAGKTVRVTSSTKIEQERGQAAVGAEVEVEAVPQSDGSFLASEVKVIRGSGGGSGSEVKFYGTISSLPASSDLRGNWVVDGRNVMVTASTSLDQSRGSFAVGVRVEVEGYAQSDGSVTASSIHVDDNSTGGGSEVKFYGTINSLPASSDLRGNWVVDGRNVMVTASTSLDQSRGSFAVGVRVEVEGYAQSDGSVTAKSIHVDDNSTGGGSGGMYIKFYDRIQTLPASADLIGTWQIGGRSVQVTSSTQLDRSRGNFAVGVLVEVEGSQQADGTVTAKEIHVESSGGGGSSSGSYFEFYGVIETQPAGTGVVGDWTIAGRTVRVTSSTSIETRNGTLQVGALVEVKGVVDSAGVITASRIEVKSSSSTGGGSTQYSQFYGNIEALPTSSDQLGEWRISGRTVTVTANTYIDREHGPAVVGAYVEVEGLVQADGSFTATKIEIKEKTGSNGRSSFHGIVETLPDTSNLVGDWKVSGRIVRVTTSTKVSQRGGSISVGTRVEVKGSENSDGSITATRIKRDS